MASVPPGAENENSLANPESEGSSEQPVNDSQSGADTKENLARKAGRVNDMQFEGSKIPVPRVVREDSLVDRSGARIPFEEWLAKETSKVSKGRMVFVDSGSPFQYPCLNLTDTERDVFIRGLGDALDEVVADAMVKADATVQAAVERQDSGNPTDVERFEKQAHALGALASSGQISESEHERARYELLMDAVRGVGP